MSAPPRRVGLLARTGTLLIGLALAGCASYEPPVTCDGSHQRALNVGRWTPPADVIVPAPGQTFPSCEKRGAFG